MNNVTTPKDTTPAARPEPALLPPVDVVEDTTGITLYADMPGVPKDRLVLNEGHFFDRHGRRLMIEEIPLQ